MPDDLQVDAEVRVHDTMTKANNLGPFNLRMFPLERSGEPAGGLTYDLEVSDDGISSLLVSGKSVRRHAFCEA
ncbi:MAG: hypothetical protein ABSB94_00850 [Syntrophorhabdales bacterium]|jgi:hypothetical protein